MQKQLQLINSKPETYSSDTIRIKILLSLADQYSYFDPDSAIYFAGTALEFSRKIKAVTFEAKSYEELGWDNYVKGNYSFAQRYYDDALRIYEKNNDKSGIAKTLAKKAGIFYSQSDYATASGYYSRALKYFEEQGDKNGIATTLGNLGLLYSEQSYYPQALDYYFCALKMAEEMGYHQLKANTLSNIGGVYNQQSDYPKALDYYQESLKMDDKLGNKSGSAITLGNIGIVYRHMKDDQKALEYYSRALKMSVELGNKSSVALNLSNIGNIYYNPSGRAFEKQGLSPSERYSKALEYFTGALNIQEELGNKSGIAVSMGNIGSLYIRTGKFREAETYLKRSLAMCDSLGIPKYSREFELVLSELYDTTGRHKLALEHYKKHIAIRDSINSGENLKKLTRIEMNYEFEKKEATAKAEQEKKDALAKAEQEKKDEVNRAEKKRQQVVIVMVSCVLVIVMVFAIFIFRNLRITRRQKEIIADQKLIVEEKHKEITDSINYAERIQKSFLASKELLDKNLNDYFVFFKPRAVVSGDFYFASELKNGNFLLACADSTGHGVPGAIMSILNISSLEKAIEKTTEPATVLNETRKLIIERLKKDGTTEGGKDGMDCSLVSFDFKNMKMGFALANNPLWIIRENNIIEFPPDKMPVGRHQKENIPFTQQTAELKKGDLVVLLTDGYADQFGGPKGKKFKYSNLKKLLLKNETSNPIYPPQALRRWKPETLNKELETAFSLWKRNFEQTDDVCVIGIWV